MTGAGRGSPDGEGQPASHWAGSSGAGRWRLALVERLPLWVQARCAVQPKALGALAVVLLAAIALAGYHFWSGRPGSVEVPAERPRAAAAPAASTAPDRQPAPGPGPAPTASPTPSGVSRWVVVDVAGRVRRPGVRRLPAGARVADALRAAGGAEPGVRMSELNRARVLVDGEQIAVGIRAGAAAAAAGSPAVPGLDGTVRREGAGGAAGAVGGGGPGGAAGVGDGGASAGAGPAATGAPVSLNTATAEQLEALPGVGPVLVQHILEYRAQHGGFRSVTELREVSGIGDKRFSDLRPLVQP